MFNSWQRRSFFMHLNVKPGVAAHLASNNGFWVLHLEKQISRRRPFPSIWTWFRESVDLYLHYPFLFYCFVFLCSDFTYLCTCPQICDLLKIGSFWDRPLPHWLIRTLYNLTKLSDFIFLCTCPQICDLLRTGFFWDRTLPHWVIRTLYNLITVRVFG
jgi:hypothetical protein